MRTFQISTLLLLMLSVCFFGCGDKKRNHEAKQTSAIEKENTQGTASPKIPREFPRDVPLLPDAKVLLSNVSTDKNLMLSLETEKGEKSVYDFYKSGLEENGWTIESDIETMGVRMIRARKGKRTTNVSFALHGGKTKVTLHISEKG